MKAKRRSDIILNDSILYEDFCIYTDISELPVDRHPQYVYEGMVGLCLGGSAEFDIHANRHRLVKDEMIVILPYQLASVSDISEDFSLVFFKVSYPLFYETMSGVSRFTPNFFFYMQKHYTFRLTPEEIERFRYFCKFLEFRADAPKNIFRKESIVHILHIFYLDIYAYYKNDRRYESEVRCNHKEELAYEFFCMILENYRDKREVAYYAEKLCITPKYLTMLVKEVTGKSAKDWIIECCVMEVKALLRNSSLDIKEIVLKTKFPNQSSLSRFFRKHTGMSPTEYRNSIYG